MVQITKATYKTDYVIHFAFSDGSSNEVDFEPFLTASQNPMTTRFRDKAKFKKFRIEKGHSVVWGEYTMCFLIESVYKTAPIYRAVPADFVEKWASVL
jgi:hypothetical protein